MPTQAGQVLGVIGYVYIDGKIVRATSCDVKMTQNIEPGNVVDGYVDKTTYSLGPQEVGGTIAFPAVWEDGDTVTSNLWNKCLVRRSSGEFAGVISDLSVKYADQAAYHYYNYCYVDTFEFNATQSETVNISVGIIGQLRDESATVRPLPFFGNRNSRLVTWNEATVSFSPNGSDGTYNIKSDEIRTFTCTVNNNTQRFYGLNGLLTPVVIAPTKRDITGSISIMGRNASLARYAYNNQNRCTEPSTVCFGYTIGKGMTDTGCNGSFNVSIPGTIFNIEEIAITNELLETTVAYRCLPGSYSGDGGSLTTDFTTDSCGND